MSSCVESLLVLGLVVGGSLVLLWLTSWAASGKGKGGDADEDGADDRES